MIELECVEECWVPDHTGGGAAHASPGERWSMLAGHWMGDGELRVMEGPGGRRVVMHERWLRKFRRA